MKKIYTYLSATLLGAIVFAGFTACHDEDLDVTEATLKQRSYDNAFIKQFGKPDANQSWDFFSQAIDMLRKGYGSSAKTRAIPTPPAGGWDASGDGWGFKFNNTQPGYVTYDVVTSYAQYLAEGQNNYTKGQTQYDLYSTGDGNFNITPIWYGGDFEVLHERNFQLILHYRLPNEPATADHTQLLFVDHVMSNPDDHGVGPVEPNQNGGNIKHNPGFSAYVHLDAGSVFWFEIALTGYNGTEYHYYTNGWVGDQNNRNYSTFYPNNTSNKYDVYNGPSQLLYNQTEYGDEGIKRYMIIGIEDAWDHDFIDFDYNDIILYIDGDLPLPVAKRFMAEDLTSFDFDFNDVVFDFEYKRTVLRAVGGTLPVYLRILNPRRENEYIRVNENNYLDGAEYMRNINGADIELHEWMCAQQKNLPVQDPWLDREKGLYKPINVGAANGQDGLEPVVLQQWPDPFTEDDLKIIGNGKRDIILYVGDISNEFPDVDKSHGINYDGDRCPSVVMGSVQTRWMKEFQTITKSYPNFYQGINPGEGQAYDQLWYNIVQNEGNLYNP